MKSRNDWTQAILEAKSRRVPHGKRMGKQYTWRDVVAILWPDLPVNATAALVYKIVTNPDYHPGVSVCERLDLVYYQPTPVCAKHGVVHCYDCETEEVRPAALLGAARWEYT